MPTRRSSLSKSVVLKALVGMPARFDADDLFERITLLQKVEVGLADVKAGRTHSMAEMENDIGQKWSL